MPQQSLFFNPNGQSKKIVRLFTMWMYLFLYLLDSALGRGTCFGQRDDRTCGADSLEACFHGDRSLAPSLSPWKNMLMIACWPQQDDRQLKLSRAPRT